MNTQLVYLYGSTATITKYSVIIWPRLQVVNSCLDTGFRISFASESPSPSNLHCCKRICIVKHFAPASWKRHGYENQSFSSQRAYSWFLAPSSGKLPHSVQIQNICIALNPSYIIQDYPWLNRDVDPWHFWLRKNLLPPLFLLLKIMCKSICLRRKT